MIQVNAIPQGATAYQFLPETAEMLDKLPLPTGPVTVQMPDEINRIQGRCYVPTAWGAAILEFGDWFVVFDVGVVAAYTEAQFPVLFAPVLDEPPVEEGVLLSFDPAYSSKMSTVVATDDFSGVLENSGESIRDTMSRMSALIEVPEAELRAKATLPTPARVPVFRQRFGSEDEGGTAFQDYCDRYRLDYSLQSLMSTEPFLPSTLRVVVNATDRVIVELQDGEVLVGYADGHMEVEQA